MDNIWQTLGITETTDETAIKKAYMSRLPANNPEDNPTGFDTLRRAYEQALEQAKSGAGSGEDNSPVAKLIKRAEELYADYYARIMPENWRILLQDEACQRLDLEDETSIRLLAFLLNHFVLPKEVWQLLAEHFEWQTKESIIRRYFPNDFYEFIMRACEESVDLSAAEIIAAMDGREWDKARALLLERLDKDPYDEFALGLFEEVSYKLIEQLEQEPRDNPTIFKLAKIYLNVQEYERCKKLLESFASAESSEEEKGGFHQFLGDCYTGLEDFRAAVYHYRQSLNFSEEIAVYVKLTNVLLELGRFEEVIHFAEKVLEEEVLGEEVLGEEVLEEEISEPEESHGLNSVALAYLLDNNARAHAGLANRLRERALALIDRAIELRPNIAHFHEHRAEISHFPPTPHTLAER